MASYDPLSYLTAVKLRSLTAARKMYRLYDNTAPMSCKWCKSKTYIFLNCVDDLGLNALVDSKNCPFCTEATAS